MGSKACDVMQGHVAKAFPPNVHYMLIHFHWPPTLTHTQAQVVQPTKPKAFSAPVLSDARRGRNFPASLWVTPSMCDHASYRHACLSSPRLACLTHRP